VGRKKLKGPEVSRKAIGETGSRGGLVEVGGRESGDNLGIFQEGGGYVKRLTLWVPQEEGRKKGEEMRREAEWGGNPGGWR